MQVDVVLEKELRVLHLQLQATGSELRHWAWLRQSLLHSNTGLPTRPYLLQHPNSANPLHELIFKLLQLGCLYVYCVQFAAYGGQRRVTDFLEVEFHAIVNHLVGTVNRTQVLCNSSKCS